MRQLVVAILCGAGVAHASGFYFGDNGTTSLLQGGAFTAQADDITAMTLNPAGLAQLDGLHFGFDAQFLNHSVTFLRQNPGFDPNNTSPLINPVTNKAGAFFLPLAAVSYGLPLWGRPFTVSVGVHAPPSVGRYDYGVNYTKDPMGAFVENPRKFAAQRYALVKDDILVLYPTVSVAYAVAPWLQVGVSGQAVITNFAFTQSLFAGDTLGLNPMSVSEENPNYDALVSVNVPGRTAFTAIFGVLSKPTSWLALGASFRPAIPITASGERDVNDPKSTTGLRIDLGSLASAVSVEGSKATLTLTLPMELRAGVRVTPIPRLGVNADFVYQGWQSIDALRLTPENVFLVQGGTRTEIAPFAIDKQWHASFSGRVGAGFELFRELTLHAGFLFETGASKDSYYSVDFANPTRVFITGGATVHVGPIDIVGGVAVTPAVTTTVIQGDLRRGQTDPTVTAGVINTGIYTSGGFTGTVGIRGHFFEHGTPTPSDAPSVFGRK
jgi:long-subunit fatty acid transport protein